MHLKNLQKIYDRKIRSDCIQFEKDLLICFSNNFNQQNNCQIEINLFKKCLDKFNCNWLEQYKNYKISFKY